MGQIRRHTDRRRLFLRSRTKIADITDGTANTFLAGEKSVDPDHYDDGTPPNNDQGWNSAFDWDTVRWSGLTTTWPPAKGAGNVNYLPAQDMPGYVAGNFGSAHAVSFNMAFCDGSVRAVNYSIDLDTFHRLGTRAEGLAVDAKKYAARGGNRAREMERRRFVILSAAKNPAYSEIQSRFFAAFRMTSVQIFFLVSFRLRISHEETGFASRFPAGWRAGGPGAVLAWPALAGSTGLASGTLAAADGTPAAEGVCVTLCSHWSYIGIGWQLGIESCVLSATDAMEMADRPPHVRTCLNMDARAYEYMAEKFPEVTARLKHLAEGKVELIAGT